MKTFLSHSPEETLSFAENFAANLNFPKIIVLSGDLGAGKTTFSKGFAKGLDVKETVTSPTFTILNEYTDAKIPFFHFDMYRLNSVDEAYTLGFENYFDNKNLPGMVVVEWAENVPGLIKKPYTKITLSKQGDNKRKIIIEDLV